MDTIQYYTDPTIHHPASCHCLPPILPKLHQVYLMKHFQIVTLSHTFFSNTILLVQYIQLKYSVCSFSYARTLCAGNGALVIHGFGKVLCAAFSSCVVPGRRKSSYAWRSLWRRHKFSSQLIPVPHSNPCVQLLYSCTQLWTWICSATNLCTQMDGLCIQYVHPLTRFRRGHHANIGIEKETWLQIIYDSKTATIAPD